MEKLINLAVKYLQENDDEPITEVRIMKMFNVNAQDAKEIKEIALAIMEEEEMSYKKFYTNTIDHLVEYKKSVTKEEGVYRKRKYAHIWPEEYKECNYMCKEALKALLPSERHQNWFHMNSSQTLCVNYFAPLFANNYENLNKILSKVIGYRICIVKHKFEYIENEGSTNFDFYCEDDKGGKYYFEIKYTENGVAKKTLASDPYGAYKKYYEPLLKQNSYLKNLLGGENWKTFMFRHYQAYRNIVMANEDTNSYCIFITMKSNPSTFKELNSAIEDAGEQMNNVRRLYWEELIPETIDLINNEETKTYYKNLKAKYIM